MTSGGADHHLSSHALADQNGFVQSKVANQLGYMVGMFVHADVPIRLVALAGVANEIDGDAAVAGREVLLLESESSPAAVHAVYENYRRITRTGLVVGHPFPACGGEPFRLHLAGKSTSSGPTGSLGEC